MFRQVRTASTQKVKIGHAVVHEHAVLHELSALDLVLNLPTCDSLLTLRARSDVSQLEIGTVERARILHNIPRMLLVFWFSRRGDFLSKHDGRGSIPGRNEAQN